jgi:iron(III) transport system substrate-binding protein
MKSLVIATCLAALGLASCSDQRPTVVVYSSVDQVFAEPVLQKFEAETGIQVRAVFDTEETKSTGVLNRLIAEAKQPNADVFWSGDPMRPFQLIKRDLVTPYRSKAIEGVSQEFRDPQGRWTPVSARARVLLINSNKIPSGGPTSIKDLADSRWQGQATIANPLFGTTTMHIAALFSAWGDEPAKQFLTAVKQNGVRIAASNGEVKRLVSSGEVSWGVTDTDDAANAIASGAPVRVVFPDQDSLGTLVMPTSVVQIRGGKHVAEAQRLIDYLARASVESYLAEHGAHIPLQPGVTPPRDLAVPTSLRATPVDYGELAALIERIQPWLREWVGV